MTWTSRNKRRMEMIKAIRPTSKAALKMQCLWASNCDVDKARKLYEFFADDMTELPDNDPIPNTWMDSAKDMANGTLNWFKENQDTLAQGWQFIRNIIERKENINTQNTPLPPINQ